MSREIKFRAWLPIQKEMKQLDQITMTNKRWNVENGLGISLVFQHHIPVMQFTGLKDKNGVEIYEGDIVKQWDREPQVIKFKGGCFTISKGKLSTFKNAFEVIGNIHQNPELL